MNLRKKGFYSSYTPVIVDSMGCPLRIRSIVSPEEFNIDQEKYFYEGAISKAFAVAT